MVLSLNQPYLILFPLEIAIYINFIQFSCQICRDLRTFHGVNFGLKDLLCVKDMTFRNSDYTCKWINEDLQSKYQGGPERLCYRLYIHLNVRDSFLH